MDEQAKITAIDPNTIAELQVLALSDDTLSIVVEAFQSLADLTRFKILYALMTHEVCVRDPGDIDRRFRISYLAPATSFTQSASGQSET